MLSVPFALEYHQRVFRFGDNLSDTKQCETGRKAATPIPINIIYKHCRTTHTKTAQVVEYDYFVTVIADLLHLLPSRMQQRS